MNCSSMIICLIGALVAAFACSTTTVAIGFVKDQVGLEAVAKVELAALDKDSEELFKISEKYLIIAQDLLKEREQTDDSFIGLGGKCIVVSHKVRIIEHARRNVIVESFDGPNYLDDLKSNIRHAHWKAYAVVEPILTEIAMMANSPPKVNFLPELLQMEQLFVGRLQQAERDAQAAKSVSVTPRPRSASIP